jgi:hypothetical protein
MTTAKRATTRRKAPVLSPSVSAQPIAVATAADDLDELTGYSGSIQGTPLDTALDQQRERIWAAVALLRTTAQALQLQFNVNASWPVDIPEYHLGLNAVADMLNDLTDFLDAGVLDRRGASAGAHAAVQRNAQAGHWA